PAILAGYGQLNMPTNVPANQYILVKGQKASASRGVGKSLADYLSEWEPDAIRYTLASVLPEQSDSELTEEEMVRRNNEELVATWGNLVQRVFTQIQNNKDAITTPSSLEPVDEELLKEAHKAFVEIGKYIEAVELKTALQESMRYVSKVNVYLNETEPWKVIKEDQDRAGRILYTALQAIDACANLLYPFMPTTSRKVTSAIQKDTENFWGLNDIKIGAELIKIGHLFKKFD
ncbi:class I tRNA ligase family protein, partial [Acidimicrobiia bacterium]|nr:class I tRNA ligase family protein [Acidimicrobiia bacterium]